jgi:TOBE domain
VVDGIAAAADTVVRDGLRLRVAPGGLVPGSRAALSIRPHQIELVAASAAAAGTSASGATVVPGRVVRASFLGDKVDYEA